VLKSQYMPDYQHTNTSIFSAHEIINNQLNARDTKTACANLTFHVTFAMIPKRLESQSL